MRVSFGALGADPLLVAGCLMPPFDGDGAKY